MTVLITGGSGFIGYHLARQLIRAGHCVHLVDNFSRSVKDEDFSAVLKQNDVRFTYLDLLDKRKVLELGDNYHVIFHLAGIVGVRNVQRSPYEVLNRNTQLLSNIIDLSKRQKDFQRLIYASTSEVYAGTLKYFSLPFPTPENVPLTLTSLEVPRTSYMLSKLFGEAMCQNSGLPFTNIRPHNIYGPRMGIDHVIPEQLKKIHELKSGAILEVPSLTHKRCFCYIDDAVEMLQRVMETASCDGQTLNLGKQDPEVSIREVVDTCIATVGKVGIRINPKGTEEGSPVRRVPDMSRTTRLVGYQAKINLAEGIQKTWEWYIRHAF